VPVSGGVSTRLSFLRRLSSSPIPFLAAAAVAATWSTWPPLARVLTGTVDYEHGPLVALISCVWLARASAGLSILAGDPRPRTATAFWAAAVLLSFAMCAWMIAFKANVEFGKQMIAPVVIWLAVATGAGWRAAAAVAAPIFYIYFAIPVWELLVPILQAMTVAVSRAALGLGGVPVKIEGLLVTIPEGSFIVQEGCSGKNYLIVTLAFGTLFEAMNGFKARRALAYLAACAGLALAMNWLRVIIVIVAGHLTNMQHYFVAREHASLGWFLFAVLLWFAWLVGNRLRRNAADVPAAGAPAVDAQTRNSPPYAELIRPRVLAGIAILFMFGLATLLATGLEARAAFRAGATAGSAGFRATVQGWKGPVEPEPEWQPKFVNTTDQSRLAFESDAIGRVEVFRAAYAVQTSDSKLAYYANRLVDTSWVTLSATNSQRAVAAEEPLAVSTLFVQAPSGARWLIDYYYVVGNVRTSHAWLAQLVYGVRSWSVPTPAYVVAAATRCPDTCSVAARVLSEFWSAWPSQTNTRPTPAVSAAVE